MENNPQSSGPQAQNESQREIASSPHVHEVPSPLVPIGEIAHQHAPIPSNLPPRGLFIGREAELETVNRALLSTNRIITIEGIGGAGKTSLALEAAQQLYQLAENAKRGRVESKDATPSSSLFDGFIWLSAKDRTLTVDQVADTIGRTLDYAFVSRIPAEQKLSAINSLLRSTRCLVIIDNFDNLDSQRDQEIINFLTGLPEPTKLIITSRRRLDIDSFSLDLHSMTPSDAIEMIRTWADRKGMSHIASADTEVLQPLYEATGGLPMAIKWALGQMKQKGQSLYSVLNYLNQAKGDMFDEIFKRSWFLLSANSAKILKAMPIFVESAEQGGISEVSKINGDDLDDGLGQLVEMSLIDPIETPNPNDRRYGIHPLTKVFSSKHLRADTTFEKDARYRAACYYLAYVKANCAWEDVRGLDRLTEELPNILEQMDRCHEMGEHAMLISFHRGMYNYFWTKGYWSDDLTYGERALEAAIAIDDLESQAWILIESLGWISFCQGNLDRANTYYVRGQQIFIASGNRQGLSRVSNYLGRLYAAKGMYEEAKSTLECGLGFATDLMSISFCESALGDVAFELGQLEQARIHYLKVKGIRESTGDESRLASVLCDLGEVALKLSDVSSARIYYSDCLKIADRIGRLDVHARGLRGLARVEYQSGNIIRARARAEEAAEEFMRLGAKRELDATWQLIASFSTDPSSVKSNVPLKLRKTRSKKIKILFLAANPSNTTHLKLDEEIRSIDQALHQAQFRDRFDLESHWAVRVTDIQGYLLRHKPNILHFSGHGSTSNEIIFQDASGQSYPVSAHALGQLFSILKENIRCVVLNACYTEEQARAIAEQIDCVVGMSIAISDSAAMSFATAFYQALGYGKDVRTAFDLGCVQINLEGLHEHDTPKLLSMKSDPTKIVFAGDN